ncbi:asparaginase-domain-containing protein [Microdochium trichocladiopsis]|uniref:asparaginase n=1 Tax=Microdochium trichocladiopsis TaxID=1682393 RepID=A0A9P8YBY6_9PEZI|nr:asparaginase-domain-containing protein [Microdochium trichocladiopsis]KAH7033382.1 asparaginase-domain-containing protein [Microdochium trichocladiopsis]
MSLPESRVLVIITGGTICMQPSASGLVPVEGFLEAAMATRPSFNDQSERVPLSAMQNGKKKAIPSLRTPPTSYGKHIRYGALEFAPLLDSSSISNEGWAQIAITIQENYHLFDGFVVLHGTDSLAYSASALSFMLEDLGKPVVLTGSQASIFALQSDAVDNLLGSLIVAGTFVIPEVCLFFHHTLFRGNRSTKVSASSFDAFASPNCEPLARVTSLGVDVNWALVRRPTKIARFAVTSYLDTAHVACIRIFPGILPEMLDSVLRVPTLRGLVLETFGMGNAPAGVDGSLTKVIADAVRERGIVIVNVSQCTSGFVSPLYAPGFALGEAGVVFGQDMTSEAALTKLGYLLAAFPPLSTDEIRKRMSNSLRGEMTETKVPVFSHPAGGLAAAAGFDSDDDPATAALYSSLLEPSDRAFTALGYAIKKGDLAAVRNLLDRDEEAQALIASSGLTSASLSPSLATSNLASSSAAATTSTSGGRRRLLEKADYAGNTVVHLAAVGPEIGVLKELLTRGASIHVRNRADNTPLFMALLVRNIDAVALLREAGAEVWEGEEGGRRR